MTKTCKTCGETKAIDDFPPRIANGKPARRPHCRGCYKPQRKPETLRAQKARFYQRHREAIVDRQREYRKTDSGRTTQRRARLAKYGLEPGHTERDWQRLLARHQGKCAYCGAPASEREHVVPLSRGGTDFIGNILPACRNCNNRKNNKFLIEWRSA